METQTLPVGRYKFIGEKKINGVTYTPKNLADFTAQKLVDTYLSSNANTDTLIRILDPAVGEGELLLSLVESLYHHGGRNIELYGYETNPNTLKIAEERLHSRFPEISVTLSEGDFLDIAGEIYDEKEKNTLFQEECQGYDLIIANPPYVRTQLLGADLSQRLASQFNFSGRLDIYYPFILGIALLLNPNGAAGIIVSNRFMKTKSGASLRKVIQKKFQIRHIWDLGDTKLFDAAVLPAVLLVEGKGCTQPPKSLFTSIYQTGDPKDLYAKDSIEALSQTGIVEIPDGRRFVVRHGTLETSGTFDGVWRLVTPKTDSWMSKVRDFTWGVFGDIGKIRVGVKTCADQVFVRSDWQEMPIVKQPELLKPLTTHHMARQYKPLQPEKPVKILYPHKVIQGKRIAIDLSQHPCSQNYLEENRDVLERRKYVLEAGRKWYEIWVPQDPQAWDKIKLIFWDISKKPVFWIDEEKTVVNGDCYWLVCEDPKKIDLLWLAAAVGNSSFIEIFYDHCFNNKLYAGRRRFMTQYVEKFPLPDPNGKYGQELIRLAQKVYESISSLGAEDIRKEIDNLVWKAFGLQREKCGG